MTSAVVAFALLWLALIVPDSPAGLNIGSLALFPLELPAVSLGLMLARGGVRIAARIVLVAVLVAMVALRLADIAAYTAFARPFNPALDGALIPAAARLVSGTLGTPLTALICLGLVAALFALAWALWWAAGRIADLGPERGWRVPVGLLFLAALVPPALDLAGRPVPFGAAQTTALGLRHVHDAVAARRDLTRFRVAAARDPYRDAPANSLLLALRGHDIFVVYVESYGRSALDNPLYAPVLRNTLVENAAALAEQGLAARSGWLTAPMVGGQSWFAHGSLLSGLRIDSQARYGALVASPRLTLGRLAQRAGWRSVAVMPAITLAWPEAGYFGYDTVLAAKDLGYRGEPFNWVTMPDQFTLAALERLALDATSRPAVMAEIALISSHAPWTPIPPMVPWDAIGDGTIFDGWARSGESPEMLWRDPDKVRAQYRAALDYALRATFSFAGRRGQAGAASGAPLFIILGDHQPAGFVSGDPTGHDVPVHLVGPPDLVARAAAWGWNEGLVPGAAVPAWPMEAFRDRFLATFGPAN